VARTLPRGKTLLSGDDNLALASLAVGATGLVSVLGNVLPRELAAMIAAARTGDRAEALRLHQQLIPLMDALFLESNPIPLKAALKLLGLGGDTVRLPLVPAAAATRTRLAEALCLATEGTIPGGL
jgi:4-hydroxy-tetrahydrodipicolinate synthase